MKKQPTKPQRQLDPGTVLLITGALANVTIWVGAFVSSEQAGPIGAWVRQVLLPILGAVSGLAMGVTVTGGLVYVLARLSRLKATMDLKVKGTKGKYKTIPNPRFYTAWTAIILLLAISPVLLAPYVYMVIAGRESIYSVLGDSWAPAWSVIRILAADLALAAIAMVHGVQLSPVGSRTRPVQTANPAPQSDQEAGPVRRTSAARRSSPAVTVRTAPDGSEVIRFGPESAPDMRVCSEPGCGMSYRWPNGKGAHYKKHHKPIPVQMPVDNTERTN